MQVNNTCQAGTRPVNILGAAGPADPEYGATGVYRVQFPNERPPDCPGPNYIVQDYTGEFSLVQSNNFTTMFLLSRNQHPDDKVIEVSFPGTLETSVNVADQLRHRLGLPVLGCWEPISGRLSRLTKLTAFSHEQWLGSSG